MDRHARRERGRILRLRAGQARPGALPHQGRPAGHRPRAQPLWPGAGLLRQRTPAHRNAADAYPGRRARQRLQPPAGRLSMKPVALSALAGVLLTLGFVPASQAVEILRWERLPLPVPLVVGQERVVFIDRNVRVGVPASVGDHLRVQSAGGAIYLRASESIPPTRLQLQDVESGALILLDIAAEPAKDGQAPLEPVRIVDAEAPAKRYGGGAASGADEQADAPAGKSVPRRETPVPVVLTRHAAQNLYAPLRTVEPVAGIGRVNLRRGLALDTLLPTLPVHARALAAWRLEDQWVTAVRLTNTSARWLDLDPRALQGNFVAATFQHPNLGPAGTASDTTVLYLVTRGHGLAESLLPALSPIDASVNLPPAAAAGSTGGARDEK
ncbi:Putative secreted protein [Bordetella parapertussis Bpp5]|uniref:Secreted protein n=2 Tax=Bordetella parapertussis TaxID=519 RepID=K0MA89_BORPB|nr:Putative secreted protein [Bordetella parapertussis Bpp5]